MVTSVLLAIIDIAFNWNLLSATAALCIVIVLDAGVGLFAFIRPNDVHWHLVLAFDIVALAFAVFVFIVSSTNN